MGLTHGWEEVLKEHQLEISMQARGTHPTTKGLMYIYIYICIYIYTNSYVREWMVLLFFFFLKGIYSDYTHIVHLAVVVVFVFVVVAVAIAVIACQSFPEVGEFPEVKIRQLKCRRHRVLSSFYDYLV